MSELKECKARPGIEAIPMSLVEYESFVKGKVFKKEDKPMRGYFVTSGVKQGWLSLRQFDLIFHDYKTK